MKNYFISLFITTICFFNLMAQSGVVVNDIPKNLNEGLNDLSEQISKDLTENQKKRIAVVEFVDLKGNVTDFGRYLSEKLITKLFQAKKFKVVERQLLNKIIDEQKLSLTGIIDATTAQKLGKLLGVDAIAAGSISDLTKSFEINARLISTETGEVFSAASVQILKDETVCNLTGGCNNTSNDNRGKTNPSPTPTPKPIKPKSWIVESNFFTFELHRCRRSGTSVICDFTITNNDKDRELYIFGDQRNKLYDEYNNESNGNGVEMANKSKGMSVEAFLVNGFATKARVYFENFSATSSKITRMDIKVCPRGSDCFYIQYRNIPIGNNAQSQDSDNLIKQEKNNSNATLNAGESRINVLKNDNYLQFLWTPPRKFMFD